LLWITAISALSVDERLSC